MSGHILWVHLEGAFNVLLGLLLLSNTPVSCGDCGVNLRAPSIERYGFLKRRYAPVNIIPLVAERRQGHALVIQGRPTKLVQRKGAGLFRLIVNDSDSRLRIKRPSSIEMLGGRSDIFKHLVVALLRHFLEHGG